MVVLLHEDPDEMGSPLHEFVPGMDQSITRKRLDAYVAKNRQGPVSVATLQKVGALMDIRDEPGRKRIGEQ